MCTCVHMYVYTCAYTWLVCVYMYCVVCVCDMCVCTHMGVHACTCVCVLPHSPFQFLRQGISLNLELVDSARLDNQQTPGTGLFLSPQH